MSDRETVDFLATVPLLEGRDVAESDGPDSQKVVIIDQFLAHKYFPNGGAIGGGR